MPNIIETIDNAVIHIVSLAVYMCNSLSTAFLANVFYVCQLRILYNLTANKLYRCHDLFLAFSQCLGQFFLSLQLIVIVVHWPLGHTSRFVEFAFFAMSMGCLSVEMFPHRSARIG